MKKVFCVISHTHWDREWYMSFEKFRLRLVDLIDKLLEIVGRQPDYIFHLDCQTVVLEDYLEIRPEKKEILKKYIEAGNIVVGPWYLQNDFYLTSGESTIRNLQRGIALAQAFGRCNFIGYAPDQFGIIPQLPQILNGFGLDTFMFGRGYSFYRKEGDGYVKESAPTEFIWKSEDGSSCLAVHLNQWYNNAQHIPEDTENAKLLLSINEKIFTPLNASPYIVLMNGVDHLEPQENVREIIDELRGSGYDIAQYRLDDYFSALKDWLTKNSVALPERSGALDRGRDDEILRGCRSSHIYLKRENVRIQTALENRAEPLYAYLEAGGLKGCYPYDFLRYAWKNLMRNHPHDSICCCSRDEVERHMEDSFERIGELLSDLEQRGMELLARHTPYAKFEGENYLITVFNPACRAVSDVLETYVWFLASDRVKGFDIFNDRGEEVPFCVLKRENDLLNVFSGQNLPGILNIERYKILLRVDDVPAVSAINYTVRPNFTENAIAENVSHNYILENKFYRIEARDGALCLMDKKTGGVQENFLYFEDTGDSGDLYIYEPQGAPLYGNPNRTRVVSVEDFGLYKRMKLHTDFPVPERYDTQKGERFSKFTEIGVETCIALKENSDVIDISYSFENTACDHRLRMIVNGGFSQNGIYTDSAFECSLHRSSDIPDPTGSRTFCNATFVAKRGERGGFALFTEGQHEAEDLQSGIALTILRSVGSISKVGGSQWQAPGGQCLRRIEGRIGLHTFNGFVPAELFERAKAWRAGLLCAYHAANPEKFAGGRFAVQDAKLAKFYFDKDKYEGVRIARKQLFSVDNEQIALSAFKRGEDGSSLVIRLVNYSKFEQTANFAFNGEIRVCDMNENERGTRACNALKIVFAPGRIVTLKLFP